MKKKKDKLDLLKDLTTVENQIRDLFGECYILEHCLDTLGNMIVEELGIPEDTTTMLSVDDTNYQCNDLWFEFIYRFADGDITKEKLLDNIKKLNERHNRKN